MPPNPRPSKITQSVDGDLLVIYAKPPEIAAFLGTLTPDPDTLMITATEQVEGHTRRRYVGGPSIGVAGHARNRTSGDRRPEQTLPGYNAWLELPGVGNTRGRREQITFVGTFASLKEFCKGQAQTAFTLRSPWGVPFQISEPEGP